jgi:ribose 5-phosphate isomerase B
MKIGIGNDHAAIELKKTIQLFLEEAGHEVVNYGTDEKTDLSYPDFGKCLAEAVVSGEVECAVALCGTGIGISLAANKVKGIRAAVCSEPCSARLSKEHNNANILALGARIVGTEMAKMIVEEWLSAEFQGGRHADRVNMIMQIEGENL